MTKYDAREEEIAELKAQLKELETTVKKMEKKMKRKADLNRFFYYS